jgi:hypothetical protein
MTVRGRAGTAAIVLLGIGAVCLAWPLRFQIDGLSMAPGLLPGDEVTSGGLPALDRFRRPQRFERWVLSAGDGTRVIKRIAGLAGETVAIVGGDLAVNGETILKGPRLLGEMGSVVSAVRPDVTAGAATTRHWVLPAHEVLDDAEFAPQERSRLLLPVHDCGLAAEVVVHRLPATGSVRIRVRVGDSLVSCRMRAAGRYAIVAGRLDGHLVAAAWPLPTSLPAGPRSCLPDHAADNWNLAIPWPQPAPEDTLAPHLALICEADGSTAAVESVTEWRDVLHRPAADGTGIWKLRADEYLVLGDFPAGSIDGRQWGPMHHTALRHRVMSPP